MHRNASSNITRRFRKPFEKARKNASSNVAKTNPELHKEVETWFPDRLLWSKTQKIVTFQPLTSQYVTIS